MNHLIQAVGFSFFLSLPHLGRQKLIYHNGWLRHGSATELCTRAFWWSSRKCWLFAQNFHPLATEKHITLKTTLLTWDGFQGQLQIANTPVLPGCSDRKALHSHRIDKPAMTALPECMHYENMSITSAVSGFKCAFTRSRYLYYLHTRRDLTVLEYLCLFFLPNWRMSSGKKMKIQSCQRVRWRGVFCGLGGMSAGSCNLWGFVYFHLSAH